MIQEKIETPGFAEQDVRIISTPSATAKKSFFYLQETGYLKTNKRHNTRRSNLQSFLFAVVLGGKGVLHYGEATYTLTKGECFFIDCRKPHSYYSVGETPWEVMWAHFNGCTSEAYFDLFSSQNHCVFSPESTAKFMDILQELMRINGEKTAETEILTSELLVNLLTQLLTFRSIRPEDNALRAKLHTILTYLNEHFCTDITLDELSRKFYISKYYLTREFKKAYGETIFQHIIAMRINYAKRLLRFTDKSVDEIAELCGFHDQSYFTKQFKKAENMTCLAFRKRWRD